MAPPLVAEIGTDQVVSFNVSWSIYESLVESLGNQRQVKLTYDGGLLTIVSPSSRHEFIARAISQMIDQLIIEWQLPLTGYRSTTIKTRPLGFEADDTYYVDADTRLRDPWNIDIAIDPPPDLIVEVDISNKSDAKLTSTYAALGVPEVWQYTLKSGLVGFALVDGEYQRLAISKVIGGLRLDEIARRLPDLKPGNTAAFMTEWREWARTNKPS